MTTYRPGPIETPAALTVVAWHDPLVEAHGHRPGSPYIEYCWLGALGPSATWAWQRLARLAAHSPSTVIDTTDLAVSLGLGEGLGKNAALSRTLHRLVAFEVAHRATDTLAVRLALPWLPSRRVVRLACSARAAHDRLAASRHI